MAGISKSHKGNKKHGRHEHENGKTPETFHVPKNLQFELEVAPVVAEDLMHLRYYLEFQWLVDFSLYAAIVYLMTELGSLVFNFKDDINLSLLWCILVVCFCTKILITLTRQYFEGEESGERSTVIVCGFVYLLFAMMILIVDESNLELGLETAYQSFNRSAAAFMERQGIEHAGPASKIVLKFFLALWCGLIGALFTFPGMRAARMHWDALRYYQDRWFLKIVMNVAFVLPFIITLLWIKPITKNYFTVRIFSGMTAPLMTREEFDSARLGIIVLAVLLRFALMPFYLQSYLNMAAKRVEILRKEAGRITNLDLQRKIAAVFYYLCVVSLQYVAPILMCLFFTFLYKTLGGYTWTAASADSDECPLTPLPPVAELTEPTIAESAKEITIALDSLKQVFTVEVYRGLLGLMTWWTCFTMCATSFMGFVYQSYFAQT